MIREAHPDDILIVGNLTEARQYPQFTPRQVIACSTWHRLEGRRFRTAWIGDLAEQHPAWPRAHRLLDVAVRRHGSTLLAVVLWVPESRDVFAELDELARTARVKGTEAWFGGYECAIRDAKKLLSELFAGAITTEDE